VRTFGAGLVLSSFLAAGTALAQTPPAPAPPAEPYRAIMIQAFTGEATQWKAPPPDLIRRTKAEGDPATWLHQTDAPIAAWLKDTATANVTLVLDVSAEGRVSGCTLEPRQAAQAPAWSLQLCPMLAQRARLIPALRADGTRLPDQFIYSANFQYSTRIPARSGQLISSYGLSPAPPPSSDFEPQLKSWPPSGSWLGYAAKQPAYKLPVEQPGGPPLSGPAIGLVVADPKSGDPECRVVQSSWDTSLNDKACAFARKKLKPKWADNVRFPIRRWALLLSPEGKGFRVIQPDPTAAKRAEIDPAEVARLTALWRPQASSVGIVRLGGKLGPDWKPADCRIYDSSGNDAADAAACRLFITEAKVSPASDVFGQPGRQPSWVSLQLRPQ
jgi:hypothetical protein